MHAFLECKAQIRKIRLKHPSFASNLLHDSNMCGLSCIAVVPPQHTIHRLQSVFKHPHGRTAGKVQVGPQAKIFLVRVLREIKAPRWYFGILNPRLMDPMLCHFHPLPKGKQSAPDCLNTSYLPPYQIRNLHFPMHAYGRRQLRPGCNLLRESPTGAAPWVVEPHLTV